MRVNAKGFMKGCTTTGVFLCEPFFTAAERREKMIVNGEKTAWKPGLTVRELLEQRSCRTDRVAVEKNGEIVPKKDYPTEEILEEDQIEIVTFVGGG